MMLSSAYFPNLDFANSCVFKCRVVAELMKFGGGFSGVAQCFDEIDLILFNKCDNGLLSLLRFYGFEPLK